jgi:hypothetical protein
MAMPASAMRSRVMVGGRPRAAGLAGRFMLAPGVVVAASHCNALRSI